MNRDRRWAIYRIGRVPLSFLLAGLFLPAPALSWNDEAADNYYAFVIYDWDEQSIGWDYEVFPLVRSFGARWIQAEGPQVLSESAHWGRLVPDSTADLSEPSSYHFERLDWIAAAEEQGFNVILALNTGNTQRFWNTYSPWVRCIWTPQNWLWEASCNCLPRDWNNWYRFVYQVVRHFDGVNGPEVRVFQTIGEPGNLEGQFFQGTAEEMYGGGPDSVEIVRNDSSTVRLPAAVVPVAQLAVHDANPLAHLSLGAPYGGVEGTALAEVHELYDQYSPGGFTVEEEQAILDLAHEYNFYYVPDSNGFHDLAFDDIEGWLFNQEGNLARRGREFIEASLEQSGYYDIYNCHLYDSSFLVYNWLGSTAINRAMTYLRDRIGDSKPFWVNGTGMWTNLYAEDKEARSAYHLVQTLVGSYAAGVDGLTYTGISDAPLLQPPISLYENISDVLPPRQRREAAGAFSLLARIFPDTSSFTPEGRIVPDPPDTDVVLYKFRLNRSDLAASGHAAIGWAVDEVPDPYDALAFDNPDCPKEIDVASYLGIPPGTNLAVYLYNGELSPDGCTQDPVMTFDEAPFLITWGDDRDGDCIPDVSDNCPGLANPGQRNALDDLLPMDGGRIEAPAGRGDTCDHAHRYAPSKR